MKLIEIISCQKGFQASLYRPFFFESLRELFIILKEFVIEYGKSDSSFKNIEFEFINCLDVFAERIVYKNSLSEEYKSAIILGANSDILLDFINLDSNEIDKDHLDLDTWAFLSKVGCQKCLVGSNIDCAMFMVDFWDQCFDKYQSIKTHSTNVVRNEKESQKKYTNRFKKKLKQYCFLLAHEFGHILYEKGKLDNELAFLKNFLNQMIIIGSENLLKNLYMWEAVLRLINEIPLNQLLDEEGRNSFLDNTDRLNADEYLFISSKGQNKSRHFFKRVLSSSRLNEELACDIFALKFVISVFGFDDSSYFITLNQLQSFMTILGYLFPPSNMTLFYNVFEESFCRYLINPELVKLITKQENEFSADVLSVELVKKTVLLSTTYEKMRNDFKWDIPDFFDNSEKYQNMIEELKNFCYFDLSA